MLRTFGRGSAHLLKIPEERIYFLRTRSERKHLCSCSTRGASESIGAVTSSLTRGSKSRGTAPLARTERPVWSKQACAGRPAGRNRRENLPHHLLLLRNTHTRPWPGRPSLSCLSQVAIRGGVSDFSTGCEINDVRKAIIWMPRTNDQEHA